MILDPTQPGALAQAADAVAAGELLGLPTETVYGLAADAENAGAVRRIFALKGRPASHPLIVHVAEEFADVLVLDGGACAVGIESAIVDCTRGQPVLLRPGAISRAELEKAAGCRVRHPDELAAPGPQAPGTLAAHYAPRATVRLMDGKMLKTALELLGSEAAHIAVWSRAALKSASRKLILRRMPDNPAQAAHELFATLRAFDQAQVKLIWVETPPPEIEWEGVRDRLERAAASAAGARE